MSNDDPIVADRAHLQIFESDHGEAVRFCAAVGTLHCLLKTAPNHGRDQDAALRLQ